MFRLRTNFLNLENLTKNFKIFRFQIWKGLMILKSFKIFRSRMINDKDIAIAVGQIFDPKHFHHIEGDEKKEKSRQYFVNTF